MHIADGFLPVTHAAAWTLAAAPFVWHGSRRVTRAAAASPAAALTLSAAGGFTLLVSSLKLPSMAGSSSHPTGIALGTVVCGPATMSAIAPPVLLLQALLLGHGGLTTLGANTIAMAVVGPWTAWAVWRLVGALAPGRPATFAAAVAGTLATYLTTAAQLALAFPDPTAGVAGAFFKFSAIFLTAQLPLAAAEAVFTVIALDTLSTRLAHAGALRGA